MKNIIVLTDFSLPSENAASYTVALAEIAKADIFLCNAFLVPAEAPMAARVAWPLMDYDAMLQESTNELDQLTKHLQSSIVKKSTASKQAYVPQIKSESCKGTVLEVTDSLVKKKNIDLVVMGMAGSGAVSQALLGSNCRSMIENAVFPVLYIPFKTIFKPVKTIAFATDLSPDDISVIKAMLRLLEPIDIKIKLIHITKKDVTSSNKTQLKIGIFLNEIRKQIQGENILFQYVWNIDVDNGLDWFTEQPEIEMIAIVHHPHSLLGGLFRGSHTQRLSRSTKVPLLVFPYKWNPAD